MKLSELFERLDHVNIAHKHAKGNLMKFRQQYDWGITIPGDFYCHDNELDSLEGMPENVLGGVDCEKNNLRDLKGCPLSVGRSFICKNNKITTLEYTPKYIRGDFDASNNRITNLKGIEDSLHTLKGKFILSNNPISANISGLLKIKNIQEVVFTGSTHAKTNEAFDIINSLIVRMNESLMEDDEAVRYRTCVEEFKKRGLEAFI